jgi:hypothetical protein
MSARRELRKSSPLRPGPEGVSEEVTRTRLRSFAARTPLRLDVPLSEAYARAGGGGELLAAVRAVLSRAGVTLSPPGPRDYVLLLRGVPVAPWIPLRPAAEVWAAWLQRLKELWSDWTEALVASVTSAGPVIEAVADEVAADADTSAPDWEAWREEHVVVVQARHALAGVDRLAALLQEERFAGSDVHLVGHSVGGATVLAYLAGCRAGLFAPPAARLRAAVTLDAAVEGLAGVWSGAARYLTTTTEAGLQGLGDWAGRQGIALLTACNERDIWSHRAISDLPYLGLRLGPPLALRAQLDGTIHGWLRRTPQLVEALWGAADKDTAADNGRGLA